ncbi:hypothetical protein [Aeromicrobium sp. 179-A 4D2 NHS]|uniref:deoxynucleotide monophosphate kinase family protein n=1 Tax=Aeromicrobium sp. 179-A 4D2 NHS TaxID=3142375 RepID=UPI00399F10F7
MSDNLIIGLHGYQRSGKDTSGDYLHERFGFEKVSFAAPLKAGLYALNPWVAGAPDENGNRRFRLLQNLVDELGWEGIKASAEWKDDSRRLQQRFGTETARETFWEDFWLDLADRHMSESPVTKFAICDARFQNEVDFIRSKGGIMVNVVRPGFGPQENHKSEQALECDITVTNDGSLDDLYAKIDALVADLAASKAA